MEISGEFVRLLLVAVICVSATLGLMSLVGAFQRQRQTNAELQRQVSDLQAAAKLPAPAPYTLADNLRQDHRAQLLSIAQLVRLGARDNLDALQRISPEMVKELFEEIAPHLAKGAPTDK
jgi:type II secretory pathway component PulM